MSNKFINNVRTRLYKQGYQGFTKDDYTDAAIVVNCEDLDDPTKEQLSEAVDYLKKKLTSQLAVADSTSLVVEQIPDEIDQATEEPVEEVVVQNHNENHNEFTQDNAKSGQLITTDADSVGHLVASKASHMGVVLNEQQINDIADSVDTSAGTFDEILEQVEQALLAYADHSADNVDAKIDQTLTRVQQQVVNRHEQSREKLAQGLTGLSAVLEESRNQTKSQLASILTRLKV